MPEPTGPVRDAARNAGLVWDEAKGKYGNPAAGSDYFSNTPGNKLPPPSRRLSKEELEQYLGITIDADERRSEYLAAGTPAAHIRSTAQVVDFLNDALQRGAVVANHMSLNDLMALPQNERMLVIGRGGEVFDFSDAGIAGSTPDRLDNHMARVLVSEAVTIANLAQGMSQRQAYQAGANAANQFSFMLMNLVNFNPNDPSNVRAFDLDSHIQKYAPSYRPAPVAPDQAQAAIGAPVSAPGGATSATAANGTTTAAAPGASGPADFQDVTIGGGTEFEQLFNELMGQLGDEQARRADVGLRRLDQEEREREYSGALGTDILNYLQGQQQFQTGTNLDLLQQLGNAQGQNANTLQGLLSSMQSGRLQGGALGTDLLNVLGTQFNNQTGLGIDLLQQMSGERLARGSLGTDIYGNIADERMGRAGLAQDLFNNLLGLEQQFRSSPLGAVDLLALGQQFGTTAPLSQVGSEALTQYGYRPGEFTGDLQDKLRGFIEPDQQLSDLAQQLMGFLQPDQGATDLQQRIEERMFQGPDQELVSSIKGAMQPGLGEDWVAKAIFGTTQITPEQRQLIDQLMGPQGSQQQSDLVQQLLGIMGQQPSDLADTISSYASGAIPRGKVSNVYLDNTTGQVQAFVVLPNGGAEFVNLGSIKDLTYGLAQDPNRLISQQGAYGPYNIPGIDVNRVLQQLGQQDKTFQQELGLFSEEERGPLQANRERDRQLRMQKEQDLANRWRTANATDRQSLIEEIAGLKPVLFAGGGNMQLPEDIVGMGAESGQPRFVASQGEQMQVSPGNEALNTVRQNAAPAPAAPQAQTTSGNGDVTITISTNGQQQSQPQSSTAYGNALDEALRRDQQFRADYFNKQGMGNFAPGSMLAKNQARQYGISPGQFETDPLPQSIAARLIGGSIAKDQRFRDPFVRALALGNRPAPNVLNMGEFAKLSPTIQEAMMSLIGPDLFPAWFYELQQSGSAQGFSGTGARALGGMRV